MKEENSHCKKQWLFSSLLKYTSVRLKLKIIQTSMRFLTSFGMTDRQHFREGEGVAVNSTHLPSHALIF